MEKSKLFYVHMYEAQNSEQSAIWIEHLAMSFRAKGERLNRLLFFVFILKNRAKAEKLKQNIIGMLIHAP